MPMTIQSQLDEIAARLARASQELQVAREQVAFQTEVSDEAQVRMVVSGTPLADREYREARDDLERLRRHQERTQGLIAELTTERDHLLERLLESIDSPADIVGEERGRKGRRA
ncbi:MAG TPA: hypothetical protein VHA57_04375 [Actinomycetota bacterium]|nr:hypothetical protein [Actinomycetota bacterium]